MQLSIVTNKNSWFFKFANILKKDFEDLGHKVSLIFEHKQIPNGEVCFILSYSKIIKKEYLQRNESNIVVHASDLPKGKGFSPLQWIILSGENDIVLTLFEAIDKVDDGDYYFKDKISYEGYELYGKMRKVMGEKIIEMCKKYIEKMSKLSKIPHLP